MSSLKYTEIIVDADGEAWLDPKRGSSTASTAPLKDKVCASLVVDPIYFTTAPLVRLSDAEAVVADVERERDELAQQRGDLAARVLELEAEVSRLTTHMTVPTVEPDSQHWAGMDGAIAFQLIERHADNWADIGRMMDEWLAANTPAVNVAADSQPSEQTI